jgi:hypothetical protein
LFVYDEEDIWRQFEQFLIDLLRIIDSNRN